MSDASEIHHGFKRITVANWQKPDVPRLFGRITPQAWIEALLEPQLVPKAPKEIAALFEVARGSMIYGWYFYPLITLAAEQSYRVLETATRMRCEQCGISTRKTNKKGKARFTRFEENIDALVQQRVITPAEKGRWDATRQLRNMASHPNSQTILTPGMAIGGLHTAAELLNRLYE